jgi:hypothetical protein
MASYSPIKSIRKWPKFDPAVKMTLRDPTFFCQSSPLIYTGTFSSNYMYVMFTYVFLFAMVFLKGIGANNRFRDWSCGVIKNTAVLLTPGLIDTAGSDPAVSLTPRNPNFSNDYLDFFGEYVAICERALAPESRPVGGLFDEKTEGRNCRDTVPLTENNLITQGGCKQIK